MNGSVRYALMTKNSSPYVDKKPVEIVKGNDGREYVTGFGWYNDLIASGRATFEPLVIDESASKEHKQ